MAWKKSEMLMDTIKHYSSFPATGVSLRQMVQFGERSSTGTERAGRRGSCTKAYRLGK